MSEFLQMSHRSPDEDSVIESVKPFTQALQVQLPLGVVIQSLPVAHVHATSHVGLFTVLLFNKTISFAEVRVDYPQRGVCREPGCPAAVISL
jgi:hypothetical protein